MNNLKICNIKDEYIDFLRKFDTRVAFNKGEKRPYIGILMEVGNLTYFAPLSSPKLKHVQMKSAPDFIKIDSGSLGVINLNNMVPVSSSNINSYDIRTENDPRYQNLLVKQIIAINEMKDNIRAKAEKLRGNVYKNKEFLNGRCCDFKLLEEKCMEYCRANNIELPSGMDAVRRKSLNEQLIQASKKEMSKQSLDKQPKLHEPTR